MQGLSNFPRLFLILLAIFITINCQSQRILVFDRDGHSKRIRFRIHDHIELRTAEDSTWSEGEITDIQDSTITIVDRMVTVSKTTAIKYGTGGSGIGLAKGVSSVLPFAGAALLSIYAINAVINNDYPVYSKNTLIIAGAFIAIKPIVFYLTYHKHKINSRHRLRVIDITMR